MKYSTVLLSLAIGAFALPQDATTTTSALTPFQSQQACAEKCDAADVTCKAQCLGVARPNESQVNESTKCAMECDQGDGSPEATKKYGECQQDCYAKFFPSSQTLSVPAAASNAVSNTAGNADPTGSASPSSGNSPSGTGSDSKDPEETGSNTESGSASAPSGTGAANSNKVQFAGAGLAGLALAVFGL